MQHLDLLGKAELVLWPHLCNEGDTEDVGTKAMGSDQPHGGKARRVCGTRLQDCALSTPHYQTLPSGFTLSSCHWFMSCPCSSFVCM